MNMNLSKKHNISRNIILSFAGFLLCLFAVDYYWLVITKVVNKSYYLSNYLDTDEISRTTAEKKES